tara:strand:+ start:281 stop:748 length:468 start_codon:yes stop_codon:yes gene_type:complete
MANFAKISEENEVLNVVTLDNKDMLNAEGVEDESVGQAYLQQHNNWPSHLWIQTSYNTVKNTHRLGGTPFRGNYAGIGHTWDSENQIFWRQKPFPSWTKNLTTADWIAPIGEPTELTEEQKAQNDAGTHAWVYDWDEAAYQADNTAGYVLTNVLA